MKFVIAPDSFKESLSAFQAAAAIKEGIERIFNDAYFELIPMVDGGEGTAEVIVNAQKGDFRRVNVTGPLGTKVDAKYGYIKSEEKAIIEIAEACGLHLV
jgi:glycerate kinase